MRDKKRQYIKKRGEKERREKRKRKWEQAGFWMLLLLFGGIGILSVCKLSWKILIVGETLVFAVNALFSFCRGNECLWVSLLTVMVWLPWDVVFSMGYMDMSYGVYPGWIKIALFLQTTGMLACAEVLGAGLAARVLWKYQKTLEV